MGEPPRGIHEEVRARSASGPSPRRWKSRAAGGRSPSQPEWGRFKFGHTHPEHSNSGLLTLVLMAYEFSKKERNLSPADVADAGFQEWLRRFEQGVARPGGSLTTARAP